MQCTLLIPHLFWPRVTADAVERGLEVPRLRKLLARSRVDRYAALTPEAWACQAFEVERQQDWPIAPLTLALDGGDPGGDYWLRADPVHIKVSREGLRLVDSRLFDVAADEAAALVAALNAHFAGEAIEFRAPRPDRWYAKAVRVPALVTHPLAEVAGKDVQRHLPTGDDALAWHRLFNEAQMLLHVHPVNEAREARGEPAVNSVWFWGGGTHAAVRGRHFQSVCSDDAVVTALAAAADAHAAPLTVDASAWLKGLPRGDGSHLAVLDTLASAVAYEDSEAWRARITVLETSWIAPLVDALRAGRIAQLTLVALGESDSARFTVRRPDLLKVWRAPKPLSAYA